MRSFMSANVRLYRVTHVAAGNVQKVKKKILKKEEEKKKGNIIAKVIEKRVY